MTLKKEEQAHLNRVRANLPDKEALLEDILILRQTKNMSEE